MISLPGRMGMQHGVLWLEKMIVTLLHSFLCRGRLCASLSLFGLLTESEAHHKLFGPSDKAALHALLMQRILSCC